MNAQEQGNPPGPQETAEEYRARLLEVAEVFGIDAASELETPDLEASIQTAAEVVKENALALGIDPEGDGSLESVRQVVEAVKAAQAPPEPPSHVRVTVTRFSGNGGVPLHVNGRRFLLPIGKPVTVPAWVIPSLEAVDGVKFTKE